MSSPRFSFALQAHPSLLQQWAGLAQSAYHAGFDSLYVADHPDSTCSPCVAPGAAAAILRFTRARRSPEVWARIVV